MTTILPQTTRETFAPYTDDETFLRIVEYPTISAMWAHCVETYGDAIAIRDGSGAVSYAQLEREASRVRTFVQESGCTRIGIFSDNSRDFVTAFLAVTTAGATAVLLSAQHDETALATLCKQSSVQLLLYQPELQERLNRLPDYILCKPLGTTAEVGTPMVFCTAETPCAVVFTGGEGRQRGALLSNGAVLQGVVNGCYGYPNVFSQQYLLALPLTHVFGLIRSLLTPLYTGSEVYLSRGGSELFRDLPKCKPTVLVTVPALLEAALTLSERFRRELLPEALKTVICGAAAVPPELITACAARGIRVFPGYGLTESANLVSGNPRSDEKPQSVGIAYPNQTLRIENGELWLKGKNMMDGYVGQEMSGIDADGWLHTGDLVSVDADGYLTITGRCKDVILLANGENISPAEPEKKFNALPFVQASQVFADLNDWGKRILALEIYPCASAFAELPEESRRKAMLAAVEQVNNALPSYSRVNRVTFRDTDFERTPDGKMRRYQL